MKIWITGSSGSLGSSLVQEIQTRFPQAELYAPTRNTLELTDEKQVCKFVAEIRPTHVLHLAAAVYGIQGHKFDPLKSLLTNSQIDLAVFSALNLFPPEWIFYSSSVACYGYPFRSLPLVEKDCFLGKPHESEYGYAQSKRFALTYLELLQKVHSTRFVYGLMTNLFSNQDQYLNGNGHVFISLAHKAKEAKKNNEILSLWGNGGASRDFISTESASKIICDLFGQNIGLINIASGVEIRISELAELVVDTFEVEKGYFFNGENEGVLNRYSDTLLLRSKSASLVKIDTRSEIRNSLLALRNLI